MLFSVGCFNPDVKPGFCQKKGQKLSMEGGKQNKTKAETLFKPSKWGGNSHRNDWVKSPGVAGAAGAGGCCGFQQQLRGGNRAQTEPVAGTDTLNIPAGRSSSQRNKKWCRKMCGWRSPWPKPSTAPATSPPVDFNSKQRCLWSSPTSHFFFSE